MANGLPDKAVSLSLNQEGFPIPDADTVEIQKDHQKVRWCAEFEFEISIDGYTDLNYGTGGAGCAFKCTTGVFHDAKDYKYTITANGKVTDPYIIVKP